ncbi:SpoIIE-like protein phosphatase domain protein [Leptospira fainei serovar Hurstbridge str. BUT 6]|uniref:SpoIIE-like protein phosphatase domain protein n=1 Tax=Leptospira fainei serovar Hurstbridge str. BUT 6 TaxID=1193011 RepID=S3V2T6_9LEPT|nr:SpoIIE family protein phosphatase [Leptospira fainei]EPG74944.1 SpoIIE-like protein phosphatase domain protein [Leptospira fainei serovar Hurstbridge str. BUT 6]
MKAKIKIVARVFQMGLSQFGALVLGPSERFVMKHRVLNGMLLAGSFAMGIGLLSEFFREGFETGGLVGLWISFVFANIFYFLARFKSQFKWLLAPTFIIGAFSIFLQIQYSGGIISANIMLLAPLMIMYMLVLGQKFDWVAILFFVASLLGINYLQEIRPGWFSDYSSARARSEDFLVTGICVLVVTGLMLRTLNRSYEDAINEVSRLKDQQDGDYFLTSLLIRPLAGIRIRSKTIRFNSYIKQKKTFRFKDKAHELGGDICVADQIILRGRPFCVFANGDAMGKSMQGAGGVLVFGTALRALIERTNREEILSKYFPERWLRTALNDLNNVFEGFDGSMSMSLMLGLVDEENGFLYYINAEHPFPIRLRAGRATFLSQEATNFKLGMLREKARIETCWIRPGDIILIGSDGRDDLAIGYDKSETRIINQDHTAILNHVEETSGNLERLGGRLQGAGELTDDLSLLSIAFHPKSVTDEGVKEPDLTEPLQLLEKNNASEALPYLKQIAELYPSNPVVWNLLYHAYLEMQQPREAGRAAENFSNVRPSALQMILNGAVQYAKAGLIEDAIDMAERVYSRRPEVIPVLKLLVRLYKKSKRLQRADEYQVEISRLQKAVSEG